MSESKHLPFFFSTPPPPPPPPSVAAQQPPPRPVKTHPFFTLPPCGTNNAPAPPPSPTRRPVVRPRGNPYPLYQQAHVAPQQFAQRRLPAHNLGAPLRPPLTRAANAADAPEVAYRLVGILKAEDNLQFEAETASKYGRFEFDMDGHALLPANIDGDDDDDDDANNFAAVPDDTYSFAAHHDYNTPKRQYQVIPGLVFQCFQVPARQAHLLPLYGLLFLFNRF
ncbi:hypothetical protein BDR26DRAFT_170520 [Obelidium mucronatum]|nr:hypothetical protein BDR26DRAFT_170520 [Obelidium mucronatum]